ncbi:MAG: DUF971 domain-containing protein [Chloroflexota bacterium]|nr:DUF971 domain-containing protein [Chloroflexota bacterium]
MTTIRPTGIILDKNAGVLSITWLDGAVCLYPLSQLREACPCVECRGGHAFMGREHDPDNLLTLTLTPARSYRIQTLDRVGNYAIQPTWDDGHHTGLYTWDYLRRLCPKTADA